MRKIGISLAEVDATKIVEDSDDFLVVPATIAREGVFPYPEGQAYKPAAELKEAAWTAEGAWIVAEKHPDTLIVTQRQEIVGKVETPSFSDETKAIKANLRIDKKKADPNFVADIKSGKRKDVSLGFFYDFDATPGEFSGKKYDFVQRNILVDHVAAGVPVGRCTSPYCGIAVDSFIHKIAVDPEETEEYIHVPVDDADDFVEDSFRTIDIDTDKGIKAVIGKLKSDPDGSTHIQKFLFAKDKDWTMEKAKAWVEENKKAADAVRKRVLGVAAEMTLEEVKAKIAELTQQQEVLWQKLYPPPEPVSITDEERANLRGQIGVIEAELSAFRKLLEEKVAETGSEPAVDAFHEIERARRLLES